MRAKTVKFYRDRIKFWKNQYNELLKKYKELIYLDVCLKKNCNHRISVNNIKGHRQR